MPMTMEAKMRGHWSLPPLVLIAGCSGSEAANDSADLNAAATRAVRDVADYAAAKPGLAALAALDRPARTAARYRCAGVADVVVEFDHLARTARLWVDGGASVILQQQPAASGTAYAADGYALRGTGRQARLTRPGAAAVACQTVK